MKNVPIRMTFQKKTNKQKKIYQHILQGNEQSLSASKILGALLTESLSKDGRIGGIQNQKVNSGSTQHGWHVAVT